MLGQIPNGSSTHQCHDKWKLTAPLTYSKEHLLQAEKNITKLCRSIIFLYSLLKNRL
jgi:hypothetical protein